MLVRARILLSAATNLPASLSRFSTISRDLAEANRELDEFFGVSNSSIAAASYLAGCESPSSSSTSSDSHATATATATATAAHIEGDDDAHAFAALSTAQALQQPQSSGARFQILQPPLQPPLQPIPQTEPQPQRQPQPLGLGAMQPQRQSLSGALTHIDSTGTASMVDVSQKAVTVREAQASCVVSLGDAFELVAANAMAKGDVLKVAQLAGICGAKATANLIPLCHNIPISKVDVQLQLDGAARAVVIRALARSDGKTGVEMEALTAASVAALTVYDMCKAASKDMVISQLQVDYKSGGRSGTYLRAGLRRADLLPSARPPL